MSLEMFIRIFCIAGMIVGTAMVVVIGCRFTLRFLRQFWMLAFGKRHFAKKAAKKLGIGVDTAFSRFEEVLNEAKVLCLEKAKVEMRFSPWYPVSKKWEIGIATSLKRLRRISYAPAWVYYIVTSPRLWTIAFMQSVGHEIAHREDPEYGGMWFLLPPEGRTPFLLLALRSP